MSHTRSRPTALEDRIVRMLLAGSRGPMPALQRQWDVARISERAFDEWGMTASIWVPLETHPVAPAEQQFADVIFRVAGVDAWLYTALEVEFGVLRQFGIQAVEGEPRPRDSIVDISYSVTLEAPGDPMELEVFPVPHRDWGELEQRS